MARPTVFKQEYITQVQKLTKLGATDKDLAEFFNVTEQTINNWKTKHPEFFESLNAGKEVADAKVEKALFERATGYETKESKVVFEDGKADYIELPKYYPPDTTACIFWLKNRRPEQWREKQEVEHSGTIVQIIDDLPKGQK